MASITPLDELTSFGPDGVGFFQGVYYLATQFLITLTTPQYAVGTYSYAIGLNPPPGDPSLTGALVSDDIRSVPTGTADTHPSAQFTGLPGTATVSGTSTAILLGSYMNQNAGAYSNVTQVQGVNTVAAKSNTTSVAVPGSGGSNSSSIPITDTYQQVREDQSDPIQIKVDIISGTASAPTADTTTSLTLTLTSAMGTVVNLGTYTGPNAIETADNGEATIYFSDYNPPGVTATNFTHARSLYVENPTGHGGVALSTLLNQLVNGTWTLSITNNSTGSVTLADWSLLVPLTTNVFAVPTPVSTSVPLQAPYNSDTQPLIIPGPHVVSTSVVSANTYFSAFVPGTTSTPTPVPYVYDQWTLASNITTITANTLTVDSGGPPTPTTPFTIIIDSEQMLVTSVSGDTWTVTRGVNSTTAAVHNTGTVNDITLAANVTTNTWTLAGPVTATATTLTVTGPPAPYNTPFTVLIDSEQLVISAVSASASLPGFFTWTIATRGANGTVAAAHTPSPTMSPRSFPPRSRSPTPSRSNRA